MDRPRGVMCHLPTLVSATQLAAATGACHICGVLRDRIGRGEMNSALSKAGGKGLASEQSKRNNTVITQLKLIPEV